MLYTELARYMPGVHWRCTPRGKQGIILRNATAFSDRDTRGARHVLIHHIMNTKGTSQLLQPHTGGKRSKRLFRPRQINAHGAAQKEISVQISER